MPTSTRTVSPTESADLVVMDAAFHHAADPARIARVMFDLAKPGGLVMLMREPTLNFLKHTRDHGITDDYGGFEREYYRPEYLAFLRDAGFDARTVGVRWFHSSPWRRAIYHPPITYLSGVLRGHWVYLGRKPLRRLTQVSFNPMPNRSRSKTRSRTSPVRAGSRRGGEKWSRCSMARWPAS